MEGQEKNFIRGKADLEIIKKVKEAVSIPVIGNGDVVSVQSANEMFDKTSCDAIMIGRGSLGRPWIFKEILEQKEIIKTKEEIKDLILKHLNLLVEDKGEYTAVREMRKFISWYIKGFDGATEIRRNVNITESVTELERIIKEC